jgi:WD40 repeat protein
MNSTLLQRTQDICHFMISFHISTSAPHTSISTRPFLPSQSPLFTSFSMGFTKAIKAQRGRLLSWPAPRLRWTGHTQAVTCMCYSPNGQHVASGSGDMTLRIWDAETGATIGQPLEGHTCVITSVAYSPNGHHIISGSYDKTIRIWNADTGATIGQPLEGHTRAITSAAYSPNGHHIISGSGDQTIRIWDAETGAAVGRPLEGHTEYIRSVAYSPNGRHIISGSDDNTLRIWDSEIGAAVGQPPEGHTGPAKSAYSPDEQHIVSVSPGHTIHVRESSPHIRKQLSSSTAIQRDFYSKPCPDGWVRDSRYGFLYWVPPDYRAGLHSPALLTIPWTSHVRSVLLGFEDCATQIFRSAQH